jgi:hypothetical protein
MRSVVDRNVAMRHIPVLRMLLFIMSDSMLIVKQLRRIIPIQAQYSLLTFRNLTYVQASYCTHVYDISFIVFRRYTNLHGSNVMKFFQWLLRCSAQRPQCGLNGTVNNVAVWVTVWGANSDVGISTTPVVGA